MILKIIKDKYFQLLLILAISSFLIFFQFDKIPKNLSFDEIEFAQLALSLDKKPYTSYSPIAFGHSTPYFYIILSSLKLFGISNFALRLPSAIFGILAVLMFYLVLKIVFNKKKNKPLIADFLPFIACLIFISSRWYLNFARFSFEATFLLFLELSALYFFLKKRVILTAIFAGLSFLSYTPGRIFVLLPLFLLIMQKEWKNVARYLLIFFLIVAPLLLYFLYHPDYRVQELVVKNFSQAVESAKKIALMFHVQGDMNGRHNYPGKPALNPVFGIIFLLGLVQSIKNIHKFHNQIFIGYFILSLIPAFFTAPSDNPNMLRTVTVIPSVVYFSVLPLIRIWNFPSVRVIGLIVFSVLIFASSAYDLRTYFLFQSRVTKNSFEIKCNLQEVIKYKIKDIPKNCRVNKNEF